MLACSLKHRYMYLEINPVIHVFDKLFSSWLTFFSKTKIFNCYILDLKNSQKIQKLKHDVNLLFINFCCSAQYSILEVPRTYLPFQKKHEVYKLVWMNRITICQPISGMCPPMSFVVFKRDRIEAWLCSSVVH